MINKLVIRNFQSHKNSILEFNPGVNVIIGKSDSGKTAVIRALRWLMWNRPSGEEFRSSWGGKTSVSIETNEGKISRIKDKENIYQVNDLSLTAFGTDVPDEVKKVLSINDINLQNQFDGPFLISSSPGEVASHFNKIARIDIIDIALKKVSAWIRTEETQSKFQQSELAKKQKDLEQYAELDKWEAEIRVLEEMESQANQLTSQVTDIQKIVKSLIETKNEEQTYQNLLLIEKPLESILNQKGDLEKQDDLISDLEDLIDLIKTTQSSIQRFLPVISVEKEVNSIMDLIKTEQEQIDEINKLISLIEETQFCQLRITDAETESEELIRHFANCLGELCPFCGQEIPTI